jgi:hypothetical protein
MGFFLFASVNSMTFQAFSSIFFDRDEKSFLGKIKTMSEGFYLSFHKEIPSRSRFLQSLLFAILGLLKLGSRLWEEICKHPT